MSTEAQLRTVATPPSRMTMACACWCHSPAASSPAGLPSRTIVSTPPGPVAVAAAGSGGGADPFASAGVAGGGDGGAPAAWVVFFLSRALRENKVLKRKPY